MFFVAISFACCDLLWSVCFVALQNAGMCMAKCGSVCTFGDFNSLAMKGSGRGSHPGRRRSCGVRHNHVFKEVHCFRKKVGYGDMERS